MIWELFFMVAALVAYLYWKFHSIGDYWTKRGVKQPKSNAFPFGNNPMTCWEALAGKSNLNSVYEDMYNQFKGERFFGTYGTIGTPPILLIRDLDLIKDVLVKDFNHFVDVKFGGFEFGAGESATDVMWNQQLLSLKGEEWKAVRSAFTPIFTSGKMKLMLSFMKEVSTEMVSHLSHSAKKDEKLNLKDVCGKYSMDTIASCAFGVNAGSFDSNNKESQFVRDAKSVMDLDLYTGIAFGAYSIPGISHLMDLFKIPVYKPFEMKFFINTITQTIRSRRETKMRRNDLIDLMIDAIRDELSVEAEDENDDEVKKTLLSNNKSRKLDESKVIATAVVMLVAGYDTTAITMSTCLWYLTQYPDVQKRLQEEIDETFEGNSNVLDSLDYTKIQGMEYLDQCIHETLRINPPVGANWRQCTLDYRIPGTDVVIPKGSEVHIPVRGIHLDEEVYPNPRKFDPDRFSKEAKNNRHPMAFLGFSQGPRNCIGLRFALLELKVGLIKILKEYEILDCADTPKEFILDPASMTCNSKYPLWVKAKSRGNL